MSKKINVPPSPTSLIEALRDIGYSIQTAIADIIDNSITANASNIQIRFAWNSGDSWLAIIDNGAGMTKDELINAIRLGSANPLRKRAGNDLGRFGLGMKTASFSQCRQLTVLSKKTKEVSCCEWDLDAISQSSEAGWMLSDLDLDAIRKHKVVNTLYQEHLSGVDN